jgi:cellulose synthase/poly-beta-1,6-N-acetylglucosamine synthase-like glycosyltransferase/peptidoglycan hydrolase-like protein with peptidoglycan-binding domain
LSLVTPRFESLCQLAHRKAHSLAVGGVIVVLSIGGGTAQAAGTTSPPSRSESHPGAAAVHARTGHDARVARRADWSAGPVAFWSGYSQRGGSLRVREVQRTLRALGYRAGPIDGLFGPLTERAVLRFQRAEALTPDGIVGPRTLRRLRVRAGRDRPTADSPKSRSPSPDRPRGAPSRETRPAPAPAPGPAEPAKSGPDRGVTVLLALLGLLAAFLGLLLFAGFVVARQGRSPKGRPAPAAAAPARSATRAAAIPAAPVAPRAESRNGSSPNRSRPSRPSLAKLLLDAGALSRSDLRAALDERKRSGGRLGEILVASGTVPVATVTQALARQLRIDTLRHDDKPVPLLDAEDARAWRAVALSGWRRDANAVAVALTDPNPDLLARLEKSLGRPVEPRLCDEATLDELLRCVYADADAEEVTRALREEAPELSAYRTRLSRPQMLLAGVLGFVVAIGVLANLKLTAIVFVALSTAVFVLCTGFRLYAAWKGSSPGATIDPRDEDVAAIDQRSLPIYTILLPLYKEKPSTIRALFEALSAIDYPKHKLDGLLLIEDDDHQTRAAIEAVGRPAWIRPLPLPPGVPRTKPRAMCIGLRYSKGALVTVYDAEDRPDPAQLKKAVWAFERVDDSVACLQAKLGYYNPRQNLLTRWFTLEYDAWFNIFLPGLHRVGAPIPLGGTSNHFRRPALDACLGWDPYNVTEDADLGLRFARLGLQTAMLESTTDEEANSRVPNWLRQRSRWSKGYMQTMLVHTRRPRTLLRELGMKATAASLLTIGGGVVSALLAPIFWLLLVLWICWQPDWIAMLFPGPIFYVASLSLVAGNFLLILLSLGAAVTRGHDDLAPHALLTPFYWVLMSAATYVALVELLLRPSHWHKTEHGLHFAEEPT